LVTFTKGTVLAQAAAPESEFYLYLFNDLYQSSQSRCPVSVRTFRLRYIGQESLD